ALAASAAIAIKSARLYGRADTEVRARRALDFVIRMNADSTSSVLEAILDQSMRVTSASAGTVFSADLSGDLLHPVAVRGMAEPVAEQWRRGEGIIGRVAS